MAFPVDRFDMDLRPRVVICGYEVIYMDIRAFYLLEGPEGEAQKRDEGYEQLSRLGCGGEEDG
jgi:hypothetical protein